jgi:hypothetical protein
MNGTGSCPWQQDCYIVRNTQETTSDSIRRKNAKRNRRLKEWRRQDDARHAIVVQ